LGVWRTLYEEPKYHLHISSIEMLGTKISQVTYCIGADNPEALVLMAVHSSRIKMIEVPRDDCVWFCIIAEFEAAYHVDWSCKLVAYIRGGHRTHS
jgi:hypothetical protein